MDKPLNPDVTAPDAAVPGQAEAERVIRPLPGLVLEANVNPQELTAAREDAEADPLRYWDHAARDLQWYRRWDQVLDASQAPLYRWFVGGQCNIVHNALDRHIHTGAKNRLAIIWQGEPGDERKFTYFELYRAVNRFAQALRSLGLGKGDRVVISMPLLPETAMAMLAAAKIGAVHVCVFPGYSARALRERIQDVGAKCVVTCDGFYRGGRIIPQKTVVDEALEDCDCVDTVVVVQRARMQTNMVAGRDMYYEDLVRGERPESPTAVMNSEDPLFLLHTSGTTGRPKAVVHSHGGYMVGVARTMDWLFDVKPTDIFWCTADLGWITGHSYTLYGPLLAGTTTVMYEGHPLYPQADRPWTIVAGLGVTTLYTTPTLIRMLMRYGNQFPKGHDLRSLRLLASVGEHLDPEAWLWLHRVIGRGECPILDTWWQTETGMCMISPMPVTPLKPGSVHKPLPGISAEVLDDHGQPVPPGGTGHLVINQPWPAMLRGLWNAPQAYAEGYWSRFPGVFATGDMARRDEDGCLWIKGRSDEVINIAGHSLGALEIEAALALHKAVAEAAVIGVPDRIKGQVAKAFVVLHPGFEAGDELTRDLKALVRKELGPVVVLKAVSVRPALPRGRSGKVMRRILRAEELGLDPGDLSSLDEG